MVEILLMKKVGGWDSHYILRHCTSYLLPRIHAKPLFPFFMGLVVVDGGRFGGGRGGYDAPCRTVGK